MASSQEEDGRQAPTEADPVGSPVVGFKMYQLLYKQLDSLNKEVAVLEAAIEAPVAKLVQNGENPIYKTSATACFRTWTTFACSATNSSTRCKVGSLSGYGRMFAVCY
jgi:hypothetical protein